MLMGSMWFVFRALARCPDWDVAGVGFADARLFADVSTGSLYRQLLRRSVRYGHAMSGFVCGASIFAKESRDTLGFGWL